MQSKAFKAALLSFLFMGLGQIYNRQFVKGILYAILEIYILVFWTVPFQWAMWGLTTLGETPQKQEGFNIVQGDHSIFLMIEGIIFLIAAALLIWVYYLNIRDAYKVGKMRDKGETPHSFMQTLKNIWENGFPYLLLTPSIIFTAFLTVLPLIFGILLAFTNYSAPNHLPPKNLVDWVGLKTFLNLFQMEMWKDTFFGVLGWTIVWAIIATFSCFFMGLFMAIIINKRGIKLKKFWRGLFILPWAVPQFISLLVMRNIFNGEYGAINQYLQFFGLNGIEWLSNPTAAKIAIIVVNIWLGFPYWMVLMSGVMTNIDKSLYEAADVDGASGWQKFKTITMPIVMFSTSPLLIMQFAGNFNNFNVIYLFTQGGPANVNYHYAGHTDILISWIYKMTLDQSQFAMASVVAILVFIVVASFSIWNFRRTRAFKEEDMMS